MISGLEVFQDVIKKLHQEKVDYMLVGSMASASYGEPRLTKDMDLVVHVSADRVLRFEQLFAQPEYYCPPKEVLIDECINDGQFNLVHPASGLKIDMVMKKNNPHSEEEFSRRRLIELWPGLEIFIATPEDVIIKKLQYFIEGSSEKHLRDIRGILANTPIDRTYLDGWLKKLSLTAAFTKALGGN